MADLFGTYDKRIKLTVDHTEISADVAWFPVTVHLDDISQGQEVFTELTSDADFDRVAFTTSDESTQIYADCELFDTTNGVAIYHVSKDGWTISSSADTEFYMYYDSTAGHNTTYVSKSGDTAAQSVWDGSFKAVYHMNDATTSTIVDSTSNNNDGTKTDANEPAEATGLVGKGQDFNGSYDYIVIPADSSHDVSELTVEILAKWHSTGTANLITKDGESRVFALYMYDANTLRFWVMSGTDWLGDGYDVTFSPVIGDYYYITGTRDSVDQKLDIDTVNQYSVAHGHGNINTNSDIRIGGPNYATLDGIIDETRISSTVRSAAWIAATNSSLRDTLLTYGSEETGGGETPEEATNVLFIFSNF